MQKKLNINLARRVVTNGWIIKVRWLYMVGVLLIGVLTKTISHSNVEFSFAAMVGLFVVFGVINFILVLAQKRVERIFSARLLSFISYTQIILELSFFTIIMHAAGGVESISSVFFFLTVVSSSLIFGSRGSIVTAAIAGLLINLLIVAEYYGLVRHIPRYGEPTLEFTSLPIALTKTITTSIFYLIVGSFSGFGAKILFDREKSFEEKAKQLDAQARVLVKRDKELTTANRLMKEEQDKTLSLISNFSTPVLFLDDQNKLALFNPAAKEILGVSKNDLGVQVSSDNNFSLNNFISVISNKFTVEEIREEKDEEPLEEAAVKYRDEDKIYKVMTAKVSGKNGNYLGVMKIFYDTTREKNLDKLKSEFISIAAHQLRTPLSAIKWVIKMVLDGDAGKLTMEQQELLSKGYQSNERIIRLVNDLLNVSRIEEGRFGYNFKETDFKEVISTAVSNIDSLIIQNHQELSVNIPQIFPKMCLDKERMIMVMQNLLSNAVKYTPEYGKVEISAEIDKQFLHVKIKDQGVGIPKADQPKLFSKFFRAANVIKLETEGTGLGLFMVKNIVEKHNGQVSIKSEEGQGTEVNFSLPINKACLVIT